MYNIHTPMPRTLALAVGLLSTVLLSRCGHDQKAETTEWRAKCPH